MKLLAVIQICCAIFSVVFFGSLSRFVLDSPSALVILVCPWLIGLSLLWGYWRVATGRLNTASSLTLWVSSLTFNLTGLFLFLVIFGHPFNPDLEDGLGSLLFAQSFVGCVIGIVGAYVASTQRRKALS